MHSILYQRGIYPPETFEPSEHFGITILVSRDEKIVKFLTTVLNQVQEWLMLKKVERVTLAISSSTTSEVLEKWDFKVDYENEVPNGTGGTKLPDVGTKDIKQIQKEIREIMRQITGNFRINKNL